MKTSFCKIFKSLPAFNFYESKLDGEKVDIRNKKVKVIVLGIFVGLLTLGFGGYLASRLLVTHYILKKIRKLEKPDGSHINHPKDLTHPKGFPQLTKEQIKIVDDYISNNSMAKDYFTIKDLIKNEGWLVANIYRDYKNLLHMHFPQHGFGSYWLVNVQMMSVIPGYFGCPEESTQDRSKSLHGFTSNGTILFNIEWGKHTSVVTIDIKNKVFTCYDSWTISEANQKEQLIKIRNWFQNFRQEIGKPLDVANWDIKVAENIPRQKSYEAICTLFATIYLRFLAQGHELTKDSFSHDNLKYFRYLFAYELIQNKLLS